MILFVDMKAAFDSVDREKLIEAMRRRGGKGGNSKKMHGDIRGNKLQGKSRRQGGRGVLDS